MNDFTQEELILLACWSANRHEQVGDDQAEHEGTFALSHKIQDMIVNYCDHERCSPEEMINIPLHCLDCGKIFE